MRRWTPEEDEVLRQYGSMGATACRRILRAELGAKRSVKAVQHRASRIGASLFAYATCPMCGRVVKRPKPSGLCDRCHDLMKAEARDAAQAVEAKTRLTPEDEAAIDDARRRRARMRRM